MHERYSQSVLQRQPILSRATKKLHLGAEEMRVVGYRFYSIRYVGVLLILPWRLLA